MLLPQIQALLKHLTDNQSKFLAASSLKEYQDIVGDIKAMEQTLQVIQHPVSARLQTQRIGENAQYLIENLPDIKLIVSAQNGHITVNDTSWVTIRTLMLKKLGKSYFAIVLETNQGSYQVTERLPDKPSLTSFKEIALSPSPKGSLPWYLSATKLENFYLDLRKPINNPGVQQWWNTPQEFHDIGWVYRKGSSTQFGKRELKDSMDGILFIERTSRARPTKKALELANQGKGIL